MLSEEWTLQIYSPSPNYSLYPRVMPSGVGLVVEDTRQRQREANLMLGRLRNGADVQVGGYRVVGHAYHHLRGQGREDCVMPVHSVINKVTKSSGEGWAHIANPLCYEDIELWAMHTII